MHLRLCLLSVGILGTVHLRLCLLSIEILGTVDFVHSDGTVVFRTCAEEKEKVVFQMVRSVLILLFFFVWGNQGWWPFRVNSGAKELKFFFFLMLRKNSYNLNTRVPHKYSVCYLKIKDKIQLWNV